MKTKSKFNKEQGIAMVIKKKTVFITSDGHSFDVESEAINHEKQLKIQQKVRRERFLNGYSGKRLLKNHALTDVGYWHVRGEDKNCDFAGARQIPDMGIYYGMLDKAIDVVIDKDEFWCWGSGGGY